MLRFGGAQRVGGSFKAVESSAEDRRFFEEAAEFGVVERVDGGQRNVERRDVVFRRVPRTDALTEVAPEEPPVEFLRDFVRKRVAIFDRPKVETTVRDKRSVAGNRAGRTSVDAAAAANATFGVVDVGDGRAERGAERFRRREPGRFGERRRNEEFAQKEARSQARRDDERMETAKTDSGADGPIFFEKRRGIDDGSRLGVWKTVEKKGAKSF